jgi:hypothetical protein
MQKATFRTTTVFFGIDGTICLLKSLPPVYHFPSMACGRRSRWQFWSVAVLVVLLTTATAVALLHSHKDWAPDCQLCHVRDLPTLHTHASANLTISLIAEWQWQSDDDVYHLKSFTITRGSRAPPESTIVTI